MTPRDRILAAIDAAHPDDAEAIARFAERVVSGEQKPSRRAPVQADSHRREGTISWEEHEAAWLGYKRKYPMSASYQDASRIADRGGFGWQELVDFLGYKPTTWQPK